MSLNASNADIHMEESKSFRPPETMTALAWKRFRRHPGALVGSVVLLIIILCITFAFLSPYDPEKSDIANRYQPPSLEHPFGTDGLGRDLLTRCLYGGRVSLFVGFMVMVITLVIGIPVCSTELSSIWVFFPIVILAKSPLTTAPGHTLELSPISTSPIT